MMLTFVAFTLFILTTRTSAGFHWTKTENDHWADTPRGLYITNCARCHGADGSGQTELGRKLDAPDLRKKGKEMSSDKIVRVITKGRDEMPSFRKKLTRGQIARLASYIRKL